MDRTICEVFKDLYREINDGEVSNGELDKDQINGLLEEGFLMGLKMNARLLERKCGWDKGYVLR